MIAALAAPELRKRFASEGATPAPALTSNHIRKILVDEIVRWEVVVKSANLTLED